MQIDLRLTSDSKVAFDLSFQAIFTGTYEDRTMAVGWKSDPKQGLILYWTGTYGDTFNLFPEYLAYQQAAEMAWTWLRSLSPDEFRGLAGDKPDIDGSINRGFYITTRTPNYDSTVLVVVKPAWILYRK